MKNNSVYRDASRFSGLVFLMGLVEFIIFSVFLSPRIDILIGVIYGCAFVSLNFFYLAYSVKKSVEKDEGKAKAYMASTYSARLILTAIMVIVAAKMQWINIWAAIIPLVFQRFAVHITSYISSQKNKGSENS